MQVINKSFDVYKFSELSEKAKQVAIENIESNEYDFLESGKQYF